MIKHFLIRRMGMRLYTKIGIRLRRYIYGQLHLKHIRQLKLHQHLRSRPSATEYNLRRAGGFSKLTYQSLATVAAILVARFELKIHMRLP
jgi:hypothetical protein